MAKERRFSSWVIRKVTFAVLLCGLGLVIAGLALFLKDEGEFGQQQRDRVRALNAEAVRLRQAVASCDSRLGEQRTQLAAQQLRSKQAGKVVSELDDLNGGFNRWTTDSAQVKENDERLARMKQMDASAFKRAKDLEQMLVRTQWEKDGAEIALQRNRDEVEALRKDDSELMHYIVAAWDGYRNWIFGFVALVLIVPPLMRDKAPG